MMTRTKIVKKLALQNYKHGTEKGREMLLCPQPVMDLVVRKAKLANNNETQKEGLKVFSL